MKRPAILIKLNEAPSYSMALPSLNPNPTGEINEQERDGAELVMCQLGFQLGDYTLQRGFISLE